MPPTLVLNIRLTFGWIRPGTGHEATLGPGLSAVCDLVTLALARPRNVWVRERRACLMGSRPVGAAFRESG